jgi:hypothetical protein
VTKYASAGSTHDSIDLVKENSHRHKGHHIGCVANRRGPSVFFGGVRSFIFQSNPNLIHWINPSVPPLVSHTHPNPPTPSNRIAHTRWATHGGKTDLNAHPHTDSKGRVAIVHNGTITNSHELRAEMSKQVGRSVGAVGLVRSVCVFGCFDGCFCGWVLVGAVGGLERVAMWWCGVRDEQAGRLSRFVGWLVGLFVVGGFVSGCCK